MPESFFAKTPRTDHSAIPNIRSAKGSGIKFLLPLPQANDFPAQVFIARQGFSFQGEKAAPARGFFSLCIGGNLLADSIAQVEKTFRKGGKSRHSGFSGRP